MKTIEDIIKEKTNFVANNYYVQKGRRVPQSRIFSIPAMASINQIVPGWSIVDMEVATEVNDVNKISSILSTWQTLLDMYKLHNQLFSSTKKFRPEVDEIRIEATQQIIDEIRALYVEGNNTGESLPFFDLVRRLTNYYLNPNVGQVNIEADDINDIVCPGQNIAKEKIDKNWLNMGFDSNIVFIRTEPSSPWKCIWDSKSKKLFPLSNRTKSQGIQGFLIEYHKNDPTETKKRAIEYINAGYGIDNKRKVIFVESGDYFKCLGLCTFDDADIHNADYAFPVCLWYFPAF